MCLPFPCLAFFHALQQRTKQAADLFEKLGTCDTRFGVKVGDEDLGFPDPAAAMSG